MKKLWVSLLFFITAIFSIAVAGEIRYDKARRRDPFTPLTGPFGMQGGESFRTGGGAVEGIVYDPKGGSYAVMGGEIYREGDEVNGAKLIKISSDRVILLEESEEIVIWLRQEMLQEKK